MRGHKEFNFPEFFRAADKFTRQGFAVRNPAQRDIENGIDVTGMRGDMLELGPEFSLREAMRGNCSDICDCTHIYLLKGWESSQGAVAEWVLAKLLGLKIIYQGAE